MKIIPGLPNLPPKTPRAPVVTSEPMDTFTSWTSAAAGAVAGAMVEGVGMAGITLLHTPAGVKKAYHDLFTSEHGALYKGGWSLGIVAAAALATPLAGVIGAGLGAYGGAVGGYHQGFGPAMNDCLEGLKQFNQFVGDTMIYEPRRPQ